MFERTAALWRRLTGQAQPEAAGDLEADKDRRVWVRYPSEMLAQYALMGNGHEPAFSARVRDVSLGGIKLTTNRELEAGTLLTVTLPGNGQSSLAVLACVVHSQEIAAGEWAVGCSFSAELEEWQLCAFSSRPAAAPAGNGRGVVRFPCSVKAFCQPADAQDRPAFEARVLNLSLTGMALDLDREMLAGTLFSAELHGAHDTPLTILACVVHVTTQLDGQRITGCSFIRELTEQDLGSLL